MTCLQFRVDNFRRHHAEGVGDDEFQRGRMEKFVRKAKGWTGKREFLITRLKVPP